MAAATRRLQDTATRVADLDAFASLAHVARLRVDDSRSLSIRDGRHPVIEATHAAGTFVPNDTDLDPPRRSLALITGPNMAGKSTYIRQNALIVLLAQVGSFVPATEARIGLVDRIFTRVGSADDISRGASTFMVEMVETANILNHATARVVPRQTSGNATPRVGVSFPFDLSMARPNAVAVLFLSRSNSNWLGIPLPLQLGFFGMGTCTLYAAGDVQLGATTGFTGAGSVPFLIPDDPALIATHLYSQFVVFDPGTATPLQLVLSNALDLFVGGDV